MEDIENKGFRFDEKAIYISQSGERLSIYKNDKWHLYIRDDSVQEVIDTALQNKSQPFTKSWEEKLYNQLKLIYDTYSDDWLTNHQRIIGDLLYDYQTKNIH